MSSEYVFTLPTRSENEEEDDWDRHSENIRPTRRGRKIDVLKKKATETVTEADARKKLDELLQILESVEDKEHLDTILQFCQWFEISLPIGNHKLYYEFLWKIINRDGFIDKYGNDEKMLKIWEKMADNSAGHAHDIYQFAISRNSLLRCANLYVRWSECVELAGAPEEARRVLRLAKTNCAVPIEVINDAEDQLEMREMRRHMNETSSDGYSEEKTEDKNRKVFDKQHNVRINRLELIIADLTKKAMKFDNQNLVKIETAGNRNDVQPFEVLSYADADDVEYLKNVHELGTAHIERYAIKESHPQFKEASTSENIRIIPTSSSFEVGTVEGSSENKEKAPKAFTEAERTLPSHSSLFTINHLLSGLDSEKSASASEVRDEPQSKQVNAYIPLRIAASSDENAKKKEIEFVRVISENEDHIQIEIKLKGEVYSGHLKKVSRNSKKPSSLTKSLKSIVVLLDKGSFSEHLWINREFKDIERKLIQMKKDKRIIDVILLNSCGDTQMNHFPDGTTLKQALEYLKTLDGGVIIVSNNANATKYTVAYDNIFVVQTNIWNAQGLNGLFDKILEKINEVSKGK